mgnify:CR=1 FL=1
MLVDQYEDPFVRIASMIGGDEYLKVARSLLKSEDATDEEKQGFASAINVLTTIKTKIECSVKEIDATNAEAVYSYTLTFAELQELSKTPNQ